MSLIWANISRKHDMVVGRNHPDFDRDLFEREAVETAVKLGDDRVAQFRYFIDDENPSDPEDQIRAVIDDFDVVGINERMKDSARLLCWRMDWPAPPATMIEARSSGAGRWPLPLEIASLLRRRLTLDAVVYERAAARFHRDFDRLTSEAGGIAEIDAYLDRRASEPKLS